jgi:hypothetical protein
MSGEGEPLLAERAAAPTEGWPVPIARQLLPGSPDQYRDFLSGETFPLAGGLFRQSRYWLKIHPSEPVTQDRWVGVRPDDLLLMETDRAYWATEETVDQRICAVQIKKLPSPKLVFVKWQPETPQEPSCLSVKTFDRQTDPSDVVEQVVIHLYPNGRSEVARKQIIVPKAKTNQRRPSNPIRFSAGLEISLDDVVAVCVLLVRQ